MKKYRILIYRRGLERFDMQLNKKYLERLDKEKNLIPLNYDRAFKCVFQKNKDILVDYLSSCFYLKINKNFSLRFLNTELYNENINEYQKSVDLYFVINNSLYIDIELNRMSFSAVIDRNDLYMGKLASLLLETGSNIRKLKKYRLVQINLNANKADKKQEYKVIPFDVIKKRRYPINRLMIAKSLENSRELYYTYGKRTREVIWNTVLTATTFTELYNLLIQLFKKEEILKFMKDVISMSSNNFILHEWEKDKLDDLLLYNMRELGHQEGHQEGRKEGIRASQLKIAKKMLKENLNVNIISKVTGLSLKKIKTLM